MTNDILIKLNDEERSMIRYALSELISRRLEQAIDYKDKSCAEEADKLRELKKRLN